jgi:AraC family transcriptional activator of pobA
MKKIPIHYLNQNQSKLTIRRFSMDEERSAIVEELAHRDDHYIFFLFDAGNANLMIDFHEVSFIAKQAYYILPGQVHSRINNREADGWYLAVDTELIPASQRDAFEDNLFLQQTLTLSTQSFDQCYTLLNIIKQRSTDLSTQLLDQEILHSLLHSFTGILAGAYNNQDASYQKMSRSQQLTRQFKSLLTTHYKEIKSPSAYADMLNITENYLNEVIRKQTGFSISYWIRAELVLEAKRLLYYTSLDAKEIAHNLGYEDHTYFFKLFKKESGMSPLSFRNKNKE